MRSVYRIVPLTDTLATGGPRRYAHWEQVMGQAKKCVKHDPK